MEDIKIENDSFRFKLRICGLIKQNDKYLIQKIEGNNFYCLPGGHAEMGEDSITAIKRELKEEVDINVKNEKLFAIIENIYKTKSKTFHEIGFYYLVDTAQKISENDFVINEVDKGIPKRLEYKWVDLEELKQVDFRPKILKECFKNFDGKIKHIIYTE